jgi:hypothetical protein
MICQSIKIQLKIAPHLQVLAGFIIESIEGLAIHSQGEDKDHLQLLLDSSCLDDLEGFIHSWNSYFAHDAGAQLQLSRMQLY